MAYLAQSDIEDAFAAGELIDLADRDGDGVADPAVVAQAIARAGGIIDSYLQARFDLPLAETPALIRECALYLVRYALSEDHATDRVVKDQERALKWLAEIRDGKMDIGLTPGQSATPAAGGGPQVSPGRVVFDPDALDAFQGGGQ